MNTLFKITLVAGVVASAMNIPAPAEAGLFSGLRGMFAPQSDLSAFEGRYVDPQNVAWQQAPTQAATTYAQSSYSGSNYVPSAARTAEPGVRYYTAEEYYGQNRSAGITGQNIATPKRNRWGFKPWSYGNVYDYESGRCGKDCAAPAQTRYVPSQTYIPRQTYQQSYRQITQYKCWNGQIVSDAGGCPDQTITETIPQYRCWDGEVVTDFDGCKPQKVTREVAVSSSNNFVSTPSYSGSTETARCPSGTSKQTDGTCLEFNSSPVTSYNNSSSYSSSSYSSSTETVRCPSGTSKQTDGTCLEFNSSPITSYDNSSSYSSSSYGSGSTYTGSIPTNCPSGTSAQSDGTCLEAGSSSFSSSPFAGSSVELFPSTQPTSPEYGYISDGVYGSTNFPPLRK